MMMGDDDGDDDDDDDGDDDSGGCRKTPVRLSSPRGTPATRDALSIPSSNPQLCR